MFAKRNIKYVVLSFVSVILIAVIIFIEILFGGISKNTVVKTIDSPNKTYFAEVVDSDQGALGGNTLVYIYRKINICNYTVKCRIAKLYHGNWGEFDTLEIYWKDDKCVVINSEQFKL